MQAERQKTLETLSSRLGYEFNDLALLDQALKHSSYVHENAGGRSDSNERLEFLGDAVLELCVSQMLFLQFPDADEGAMSKARSSLVNEANLAKAARKLGLGQFMMLGRGEEIQNGREKPSLLSDAVEAILAAIYLDGGLNDARQVVELLFSAKLPQAMKRASRKDFKTRIQEKVQERLHITPRYHLVEAVGPDHEKEFRVMLVVDGQEIAQGHGKSKKEAEQQAAQKGLELLEAGLKLRQR
jgi:ribonuclease-3